jgi:hypothetical protein
MIIMCSAERERNAGPTMIMRSAERSGGSFSALGLPGGNGRAVGHRRCGQ